MHIGYDRPQRAAAGERPARDSGSGCGGPCPRAAIRAGRRSGTRRDPLRPGRAPDAARVGAVPGAEVPAGAARALRAVLPEQVALGGAERHLLKEWLDRLAADG